MACSKYEYVKKFEEKTVALLQTFIMVRVDGRGFTKFCALHDFKKPNDLRAIKLMNAAAEYVCNNFTEIFLAYGQSDEYSFVFNKNSTLFSRRTDKILSCVVSAFTSAYVFNWKKFFDIEMQDIPTFDSRIVLYPNETVIKDYFKWRQVDCHINNLYNTVFWEMVRTGKSNQEVQAILKDTNSGQKNQILFSNFGINYNTIEQIYRRGTLMYYETVDLAEQNIEKQEDKERKPDNNNIEQQKGQRVQPDFIKEEGGQTKKQIAILKKKVAVKKVEKIRRKLVSTHEDLIKEEFWIRFFK